MSSLEELVNNYRRFLVEVGYIPENEEFAEIRVTDTKNLDSDSDADSGWDTESDRNRDNESEVSSTTKPRETSHVSEDRLRSGFT